MKRDNQIINLMKSHRSIRKFKDKTVEDNLLRTIVRAAQSASTSHNVQAGTIIRVEKKEVRTRIAELAGPQPWVEQAPVFLVFCADLTRLEKACQRHEIKAETGWAEQLLVAVVDTALLAQNLMLAAESFGLGGVFIGGIRNDTQTVCRLLDIPDQAFPLFGMCLGYPDQDPGKKPRLPLDLVLRKDSFKAGEDVDRELLSAYDEEIRAYYRNRDESMKDQTWSLQMAQFTGRIIRPHMKSFLEKRGFFKK